MKCNKCWKSLDNEVAYITTCSHIFCEPDARKVFTKDKACPLLTGFRSSITGVELVADDSKVLPLCGLSPKEILEISGKAVTFWAFQKQLELEYCKLEAKKKDADLQQLEKTYNDKMLEAANQINTTKHRLNSMREELERDRAELKELREKYEEKSRQKRKLEELYEALKHKPHDPNATPSSPTFFRATSPPPEKAVSRGNAASTPTPRSPRDRFALLRRAADKPAQPPVATPVVPPPRLLPTRSVSEPSMGTSGPGMSLPLLQKPATPLFAKRASSLLASI